MYWIHRNQLITFTNYLQMTFKGCFNNLKLLVFIYVYMYIIYIYIYIYIFENNTHNIEHMQIGRHVCN